MQPEIKSTRQKWIRDYEQTAKPYAACLFLEEMGSGQKDAEVVVVVDLHDRYSKAMRKELKIA